MHFLGLAGMPRRVYTFDPKYTLLNALATLGAYIMAIAIIPFIVNVLRSRHIGEPAGDNPWRALTLEWTTSSPPPDHNFDGIPVPAPDPYGYGTPEGAAYLASAGKIPVPMPATPKDPVEPEPPAAGD